MRRFVYLTTVAAVALVSGCGSSSSDLAKSPTTAASGGGKGTVTGPVNAAELVATGDAVTWSALSGPDKTAVADRYLTVAGVSGVDTASLVAAADTAASAGAGSGSMRDFLGILAAAIAPAGTPSTTAPSAAPAVKPVTDVRYTSRCSYLLGDFSESASGLRFVADASLTSEANIGTINRVTAIWDQIGTSPVKVTKTVRLGAGAKRKVQFTKIVTRDQLDLHQGADGECRTKVSTIDTFGEVG